MLMRGKSAGYGIAIAVFLPQVAFASTYDLKGQWVNGANPNGPWSLVQGSTALPYIQDWYSTCGSAQPAYAPNPYSDGGYYLPAWFRQAAKCGGEHAGTIILHSTDPANGIGFGPASVKFVAPSAGKATISGYIYPAAYAVLGRPQSWSVVVNGETVASGTLADDGSITRKNPVRFRATHVALNIGDTVALTVVETGGLGTFMGVELKISVK